MRLKRLQHQRSRVGPRPGVPAFSLVELLMLIGIIALLAGLLYPALAKPRAAAQTVRCLSNLRQMGFAARMYWEENGGRAFPEGITRTNGGQTYWFGWLQDGPEGARDFDPRAGRLWPYLQGRGVEICPGLNRGKAQFKSKARGAAFGYGYNLYLGPRDPNGTGRPPPVLVDRLTNPSAVAVFADCGQVNNFQAPASLENPMLEEFYFFETAYPTVHFRHGLLASVDFIDGHVGRETVESGSEDHRLPGQLLGRLAREIVVPQ